MYYKRGDLVLVKIEDYPFWPAEIASILSGELYNVIFYGEKSEAVVNAKAVKELTWERGKLLQRQAALIKNKKLRVAIRLALKRLSEYTRERFEGEQTVSKTTKHRQKGRSHPHDRPRQPENSKDQIVPQQHIRAKAISPEKMDIQTSPSFQEEKMDFQKTFALVYCGNQGHINNQMKKPILRNQYEYDSLRSLLKQYSLGLINKNSANLSAEEKEKMMSLLTERELLLQELIEYWIIQKICSIITLVCFRGIPNQAANRDTIAILIDYFQKINKRICSNEIENFAITTQRKQRLILRVRQTDSYLRNPQIVWKLD